MNRLDDISKALKLLQGEVANTIVSLNDTLTETTSRKGPKTALRIVYNGKLIIREHGADTLAEVVRRIGAERIHSLDLKLGGLPLIGKVLPPADRGYRTVDGWIVGTHASNADNKAVLEEIARRLAIDLRVEILKPVA